MSRNSRRHQADDAANPRRPENEGHRYFAATTDGTVRELQRLLALAPRLPHRQQERQAHQEERQEGGAAGGVGVEGVGGPRDDGGGDEGGRLAGEGIEAEEFRASVGRRGARHEGAARRLGGSEEDADGERERIEPGLAVDEQ